MTAILAGMLIGIGDIALLTAENKVVGALLFSVALLSIIRLRLPLYTGKIGRVIVTRNPLECLRILGLNVLGVWIVRLYPIRIQSTAEAKFSRGYLELFAAGILCNILIHVAVTAKDNVITILCVMVFILAGFEHSIADSMYLAYNLPKWLVILAGNTVGGIGTELLLGKGSI